MVIVKNTLLSRSHFISVNRSLFLTHLLSALCLSLSFFLSLVNSLSLSLSLSYYHSPVSLSVYVCLSFFHRHFIPFNRSLFLTHSLPVSLSLSLSFILSLSILSHSLYVLLCLYLAHTPTYINTLLV